MLKEMTSIANTTPSTTPAAPVAAAPAPPAAVSPPALSMAQMTESNVPATVYNEMTERIKTEMATLSKQLEDQKKEYVMLGMSLAKQDDLATTIAKNPDLMTEVPDEFKPHIQNFQNQYNERKAADKIYGAADPQVFDSASLVVGMSIAGRKRAAPGADTTMTITKRGTDASGSPLATQAAPTSDAGPIISRPSAPAPALVANASTGGQPMDLLAALNAGLSSIKERNAKVGMHHGTYSVSVANYSSPANTVDYRDVRNAPASVRR